MNLAAVLAMGTTAELNSVKRFYTSERHIRSSTKAHQTTKLLIRKEASATTWKTPAIDVDETTLQLDVLAMHKAAIPKEV